MYRSIAAVSILVLIAIVIGGCTEIERRGYSPIPQNSPGSWEINPYS